MTTYHVTTCVSGGNRYGTLLSHARGFFSGLVPLLEMIWHPDGEASGWIPPQVGDRVHHTLRFEVMRIVSKEEFIAQKPSRIRLVGIAGTVVELRPIPDDER